MLSVALLPPDAAPSSEAAPDPAAPAVPAAAAASPPLPIAVTPVAPPAGIGRGGAAEAAHTTAAAAAQGEVRQGQAGSSRLCKGDCHTSLFTLACPQPAQAPSLGRVVVRWRRAEAPAQQQHAVRGGSKVSPQEGGAGGDPLAAAAAELAATGGGVDGDGEVARESAVILPGGGVCIHVCEKQMYGGREGPSGIARACSAATAWCGAARLRSGKQRTKRAVVRCAPLASLSPRRASERPKLADTASPDLPGTSQ